MSERPRYRYWPGYCEENVWHLCAEPELAGRTLRVAFVSNPGRQVAVRGQRLAPSPLEPLTWDYHVILLARNAGRTWQVWDLDTTLGCPLAASAYLDLAFPAPDRLPQAYAPLFRVLTATEYRRELRTDRRHMRRADGTYHSPPPPWPPIGEGSNLMRFAEMESTFFGDVLDLGGLRRRLDIKPRPGSKG